MIKHFDVVLRCEGPVHIGAGTQIPKRELWYDEKKQRLSVLDIPRMMRDLTSRQRESLYSFLLGKTNRFEMRQMLSDMGLQEEKIRQWEKYGFPFQKNAYRNMRDIMCCVKDGFGFPYVPGSSLKGALRTIFFYQIQNDKQAKEKPLTIWQMNSTGVHISKTQLQNKWRKKVPDWKTNTFRVSRHLMIA